jgi:hypothetical protein
MSFPELLQRELDEAIGHGPAHRPVEQRIDAGRRALRRRRAAAGLAAFGMVAVLGAGYAVSGAGLLDRATGDVATEPTPSPAPSPSPTQDAVPTDQKWEDHTPIRYLDGELQVRPGAVVHEHIENPYDYQPPRLSDALDLTFEGQRTWIIAEQTKNGFGYSSSVPSNSWPSFSDWVAEQVGGATGGDDGWPDTLRLTAEGTVVASEGSEILQRTDDPKLGGSFAPPRAPTGAALVRAAEDDFAYFVVWRVLGGELDVITTPPRDITGATFQEMLTYARAQYASGEGL